LLDNINFKNLNDLINAPKPMKQTVEALGRMDANLYSAEFAINFMKAKLEELGSDNSIKLLLKIKKRMEDRTNNNLMKLLKCLKSPDIVPPKQFLD
jgi:hypothetical protein